MKKLIATDASIAILVKNYIVSYSNNEVKIYDTLKDTVQVIIPEADRICTIHSYNLDENYVAFSYYDKPNSFHRDLGIIDLKKSEVHYVNIPDNIIFNTLSFIDNNQLIINYYYMNNKDKIESMFFDLSDLIAKEVK